MIASQADIKAATATEIFQHLVRLRSMHDEHSLAEIPQFVDTQLTGFGTAAHEIFKSSEDIFQQLQKEKLQTPNGFSYDFHWVREQKINDLTAIVTAETRITVPLPDRTLIFDPVRMSAVFHRQTDGFKLAHWHTSFPDNSGSDEIFPGSGQPKKYENVTVVFTDFINFTEISANITPDVLVAELNALFVKFDALANKYGLDKIKTIGDSYMAVSGICCSHQNGPAQAIKWSRAVLNFLRKRNLGSTIKWDIRIGIHTGTVTGGVIGTDKLSFDIWGDTVNVANRMETMSAPNRVNISEETYRQVKDLFPFRQRGTCEVKGKGCIRMYYLEEEPISA